MCPDAPVIESSRRWDMSVPFASVESEAFRGEVDRCTERVDRLQTLLAGSPPDPGTLDAVLRQLNAALGSHEMLEGYVGCVSAADTSDASAQAAHGELLALEGRIAGVRARLVHWVGALEPDALLDGSPAVRDHAYPLQRMHAAARHLMPPDEEVLAAELRVTGGDAWARLQADLSSSVLVEVAVDGTATEVLPMSAVRALASSPDPAVRRRAYDAEIGAWERHAGPFAAALNAIKGEEGALARRRGWASPLDAALFEEGVERDALDALMAAIRSAAPQLRRHLRAKARTLGVPVCAWHDLEAPLPSSGGGRQAWSYEDAVAFVAGCFASYSSDLAALAERAARDRWVDVDPREGKVGGGFCARLRGGESRILMNFEGSYQGVSTLAHELGHAYHNLLTADLSPLAREFPHVVAETASMLCEQIVSRAALGAAGPPEELGLLDTSLQRGCELPLEILARFTFESRLVEMRRQGMVSARVLCEMTREAQEEAYGEALDPSRLHPYLWAVKPHYYAYSFYNYPYAFGELLGRGLYARFSEDPEAVSRQVDAVLADAGRASPAELVRRIGIDIGDEAFWASALARAVPDLDRYEELVGAPA